MIYQRRKPMNMYNGLGGDMRSAVTGRLLLAGVLILFALFSYFGSRVYNPVTGENQHISITEEQEIALGLEAVPQMMQQFGGEYPDPRLQEYVDQVGFAIVNNSAAKDTNWKFEFHLLDDPKPSMPSPCPADRSLSQQHSMASWKPKDNWQVSGPRNWACGGTSWCTTRQETVDPRRHGCGGGCLWQPGNRNCADDWSDGQHELWSARMNCNPTI